MTVQQQKECLQALSKAMQREMSLRGFTGTSLAEASGINKNTISDIINCNRNVSYITIVSLFKAMGSSYIMPMIVE